MNASIENIANTLLEAEKSKEAVSPLTSQFKNLNVTDAYHVQLEVIKRKLEEGRTVIGKKVGLTSVAMQKMLGVDEPDYGHLLDDMKVENGGTVKMSNFLSPKIEAEIGFVLSGRLRRSECYFSGCVDGNGLRGTDP